MQKKNHDKLISAILCVEFPRVQKVDLSEIVISVLFSLRSKRFCAV